MKSRSKSDRGVKWARGTRDPLLREHYEGWRYSTEEAKTAAERAFTNRRDHTNHLDGMAYWGESLATVLSRVHEARRLLLCS